MTLQLFCIVCVKEGIMLALGKLIFEGNSYCIKHYLELLEWRRQHNPGRDIFPYGMFGDLKNEK